MSVIFTFPFLQRLYLISAFRIEVDIEVVEAALLMLLLLICWSHIFSAINAISFVGSLIKHIAYGLWYLGVALVWYLIIEIMWLNGCQIDTLLLMMGSLLAGRQGKQMLGFQEDESGGFGLEIRFLGLDHQEGNVGLVAAGEAFGNEASDVLGGAFQFWVQKFSRVGIFITYIYIY